MLRLQSVCSNPLVCSNITRSTVKTRPFRLVRSTPFRGFSAAMAPQQEWLVLLPDVEGMLEKRKEIRPYVMPFCHVENSVLVEAGHGQSSFLCPKGVWRSERGL